MKTCRFPLPWCGFAEFKHFPITGIVPLLMMLVQGEFINTHGDIPVHNGLTPPFPFSHPTFLLNASIAVPNTTAPIASMASPSRHKCSNPLPFKNISRRMNMK